MFQLNRPEPAMPVQAYQTYQAVRPTATHSRPATCKEVECRAHANGWKTTVDVSTPTGRRQANYIRMQSGRSFTAEQPGGGTLVTFTFPAGQRCFAEHRVNIERPTLYLRRGGDWRGTTFEAVRLKEADWVDDFANHQIKLAETMERG